MKKQNTFQFDHNAAIILESIQEAFIAYDTNWKYVYLNKNAEKIIGRSRELLLGKVVWDVYPSAIDTEIGRICREASMTQKPYFFDSYFDPLQKWFAVSVYPSESGVVTYFHEITRRKELETKLKKTNEQYQIAAKALNCIIYDWDVKTNKIERIGDIRNLLGYDANEVKDSGAWWFEQIHPEDKKNLKQVFRNANKQTSYSLEYRIKNKAGEYVYFWDHGIIFKDQQSKNVRYVGSAFNISDRKKTEDELNLFKFISDTVNDAYFLMTREATLLYVNQTACKSLGYTKDELLKLNVSDINAAYDLSEYKSIYHRAGEDHISPFESVYKRKDGSVFPVEVSVSGVTIDKTKYIFSAVRDITDRKKIEDKLKESEEKYKIIVEGAKDFAIMTLDENGKISSWNEGAKRILGYNFDEVQGKNAGLFFPDPKDAKKEIDTAIESGKAADENWHIKKDGSKFWASGVLMARYDKKGKVVGYIKILRDLTEKMQLEERKDIFIGLAGHELKTPLTTIKAYTQILKRSFKKSSTPDPTTTKYLDKIETHTNKLEELVNDLLDISKIEEGRLGFNPEIYNFDQVLNEIIEDMDQMLPNHSIKKIGVTNKKVNIDKDRISQALGNLIANAAKYSPDNKKVIVKSSVDKKNVICSITDFGIGIPKEKQVKIFEKFYRAENDSNKTISGLGLGLYIADEIIRKHNGQINVESELGKGSTFYITIPIYKK
jgi:PAS domain S-box-containing protein